MVSWSISFGRTLFQPMGTSRKMEKYPLGQCLFTTVPAVVHTTTRMSFPATPRLT